jgi:hypothetical protein
MNFSQLSQAIQDYCETTEPSFIQNIPNFIQQAEERIYNSVQLPAIRKNVTGTISAGNSYLSLPSDYLAAFSVAVFTYGSPSSNYLYLLDKDVNFIRESFPASGYQAQPQYYAQFQPYVYLLGPTPDVNYGVELHYYYYPESIVTAGSSWVGDNFETVLLYGSLREAYLYLKGEQDLAQQYDQKYQESLGLLKILGDGKDRRDAYRSGQTRVPVP